MKIKKAFSGHGTFEASIISSAKQGRLHPPPSWAKAARIIFALSPNSAACERVFSLLKNFLGDQQMTALADGIAAGLMLASGWHTTSVPLAESHPLSPRGSTGDLGKRPRPKAQAPKAPRGVGRGRGGVAGGTPVLKY